MEGILIKVLLLSFSIEYVHIVLLLQLIEMGKKIIFAYDRMRARSDV